MKKLQFIISSLAILIIVNGCIQNEPEMPSGVIGALAPEFEEGSVAVVGQTASSITVTATISKENGYKVTERGFYYWDSQSEEESEREKVWDTTGTGTGTYTLTINNLKNNKEYTIRPYAVNEAGTRYGEPKVVPTNEGKAIVSTLKPDIAMIRASSALIVGKIDYAGEGEIQMLGFYKSENRDMEVADTIYIDANNPKTMSAGETFSYQLTLLTPSTRYYIQAFVKNTYGTSCGNIDSLDTRDGKPVVGPTVSGEIGYTDVRLSSSVTNGGDETVFIAERGFCWAAGDTILPDTSNTVIPCGEGVGGFNTKIEDGLVSGGEYYARAYAISNSGIVVYGKEVHFQTNMDIPTLETEEPGKPQNGNVDVKGIIKNEGISSVTASGICWSTDNPAPTKSDNLLPLAPGAGGVFSGQLTGLRGGITYYVRAYATNAKGTGYGVVREFTPPPVFTEGLETFAGESRLANSLAYFAINGYLYIVGGDLGPGSTNELWRYSIASDRWEQRQPFSGGPAKWQFGIRYGNGALVYGGYNGSGAETSGIYEYKGEPENVWVYYEGPDSAVVYKTVGYSQGSSAYYIGGRSGDTIRQDVWRFEYSFKTWQRMTDFPVKQYGGVAVEINGIVYAGLGSDASGACNKRLWSTTNTGETLTWNDESTCPYPITGVFGGIACNDRLYIVDANYDILEFNPATHIWTKKSQLPPSRRSFHCIFSENGKIYIGMGNNANSIMIYDPIWDNELY